MYRYMLESMSWVIGIAIIGKDLDLHLKSALRALLISPCRFIFYFQQSPTDILKELLVLCNIKRHFVCKKVLYYV